MQTVDLEAVCACQGAAATVQQLNVPVALITRTVKLEMGLYRTWFQPCQDQASLYAQPAVLYLSTETADSKADIHKLAYNML